MRKGSKCGLWKSFGSILRFYTKNSPQNSWSPHFILLLGTKNHKIRWPPVLLLPLWYYLFLPPTNLAAEKLTAFILCSARKKLANLLTFAVLNHSIQVYLSAFKRIRELDIWNWTQFIDYFYLLDQKHCFLASEFACFSTFSPVPRTIFESIQTVKSWQLFFGRI